MRVVAPLLSFTADEVWTHLPAPHLREKSVHLAKYVSPADLRAGLSAEHLQRMENWPRLIALREEVLKALEVARQEKFIGGSLEARVVLVVTGDLQPLVEEYRDFLRYLFIVSQVEITQQAVEGATATGLAGLSVKIEKALRPEMRSLLELFRTGRKGPALSHGVRTMLRGAEGNRGGIDEDTRIQVH